MASLSAAVAYKKVEGTLELTEPTAPTGGSSGGEQALLWTAAGESTATLRIAASKLKSLFASKDGGVKVMIRIAVEGEAGAPETLYNFTFTSAATAISDREHFKRDIAAIVAANREQPVPSISTATALAAARPAPDPPVDDGHLQEPELKRRVLEANPDLKRLFGQLVVKERRLTEADFWENRQHLLEEERFVAGGQRKGRVATIQGPQLQTTASGETRISVTPEIIREIFEVYPVVQRAYNENVPPLSESEFWSRYFQSKLFAQTRSTTRNAGDTVKADPIFDRYLGEEDDDLEPKRLQVHEIYRLLDLEATASDHVEADVTMRAGSLRSSLPLMRRFNERSERLLDAALGDVPNKRQRLAFEGGSRDYYHQIEIEDLQAQSSPALVKLAVSDPRQQGARAAIVAGEPSSRVRSRSRDSVDFEGGVYHTQRSRTTIRRLAARSQPGMVGLLELLTLQFRLGGYDAQSAAADVLASLGGKSSRAEADQLPQATLNAMTACQSATMEYLRHFWTALSPDAAANARLTAAQRAAKAQRMVGYLSRTQQRVDAVIADAANKGVEAVRIEHALGSVIEASRAAITLYQSRIS